MDVVSQDLSVIAMPLADAVSIIAHNRIAWRAASFFFGVRIRLGTILGRFSIIYFRGLGLTIRVRVWVMVRARVRVSVRVGLGVRVSVVLWSW